MPQPISKAASEVSISIANGGQRIGKHNPKLGLLGMEVIASWSNVESFLMRFYIELLGGAADLAATAYLALEARSARSAVITAVARARLDADHVRLLEAILAVAKSAQRGRDRIAHWTWGYSRDIPDAVLLADPKDLHSDPDPRADIPREKVLVYKQPDFEELIRANDRLCGFCLRFLFILQNHPSSTDGQLFARLSMEPEIRERLGPRPA